MGGGGGCVCGCGGRVRGGGGDGWGREDLFYALLREGFWGVSVRGCGRGGEEFFARRRKGLS